MAYNNYRQGGNQGTAPRGGQNNQGNGGGYQRQQPQQSQGNQNGPKVDWKANRIGGIYWHKNGKGLSGRVTIDGVTTQIVVFENTLKQEGETTPDFWIHSAPDQGQGAPVQNSRPAPQRQNNYQQGNGGGNGGARQGQARSQQTRRAPQQSPVQESPEPDFQEGDGPQVENADF